MLYVFLAISRWMHLRPTPYRSASDCLDSPELKRARISFAVFALNTASGARIRKSGADSVLPIFRIRHPLKIADVVILLISVDVIYLRFAFWIWKKSRRHKTMNREQFRPPIYRHTNPQVTILVCHRISRSAFLDVHNQARITHQISGAICCSLPVHAARC